MSCTPHTWTSNLSRVLTMLVGAGFAASGLVACGSADSSSGGSSAAVAASAAIASAMASSEATSGASTPAPAAASTSASSGGSGQNGFTDAQACTWAKQELVALRKVGNNPDIVQISILSSLQDFLNKHGGFSDEIKQGSEVTEATQRACPTQHDELLKKADLKSLGDLP